MMPHPIEPEAAHKVLIVEDDLAHARLMRASLRKVGIESEHAGTQEAALRLLRESDYDVVLLDMTLPDGDGFEIQQWLTENALPSSIVFVTADDLAEHAVKAVRAGAANYVVKRPDYLTQLVEATVEALEARAERAGTILGDSSNSIAQRMIGWSSSMVEARKLIAEFAPQMRALLVVGESGTGRSAVSRLVHSASKRTGAFVVANCRELSERLEKGGSSEAAFVDRLAESAKRGTLVLEDITEASQALQSGLLSAIEDLPQLDVRLIVESEFDPAIDVVGIEFMEGLWIRLSGTRIELAPLRDRKEDVRPIASRELTRLGAESSRGRFDLDEDAWAMLETHGWNGNVQELLACIRAIVASSETKSSFDRFDTEAALRDTERRFSSRSQHDQKERSRLKAALDRHDWNVTATAKTLGVSRGWLRRRIEWFDL